MLLLVFPLSCSPWMKAARWVSCLSKWFRLRPGKFCREPRPQNPASWRLGSRWTPGELHSTVVGFWSLWNETVGHSKILLVAVFRPRWLVMLTQTAFCNAKNKTYQNQFQENSFKSRIKHCYVFQGVMHIKVCERDDSRTKQHRNFRQMPNLR